MMKIFSTIIILFFIKANAQEVSHLNQQMGINDSIQTNEIRIYKIESLTDYSSVTRIYKDSSNKWRAENYKLYSRNKENNKKESLKVKNNDSLWAAILTTKIQFLPDLKTVEYKLSSENEVILFQGEYQNFQNRKMILDGTSYRVQIKTEKQENDIYYSNPESYLKIYPEVDELIYFNKFLSLLHSKLKI